MNISSAAKTRYSTKAFDSNKKLTSEQVMEIKDLLQLCASSVNSQPWHFILASSDEAKAKIAQSMPNDYVFNQTKVLNASHVVVLCTKTDLTETYLDELLKTEESAGRFSSPESKARMGGARQFFINQHRLERHDLQEWMAKQVYLNAGSLLLGVAAMGIDAVPIEGFDPDLLNAEFDLGAQGLTSTLVIPLGFHSEEDFNAHLPKSRWPQTQLFTEC